MSAPSRRKAKAAAFGGGNLLAVAVIVAVVSFIANFRQAFEKKEEQKDQEATNPLDTLHQLPYPPKDFTGRKKEIGQITRDIRKGITISGLQGLGGIGKTALGLVIAQSLKGLYPDGQLFLDLRGAHEQQPLTLAEIMIQVLHSFHPEDRLPDNETELLPRYFLVLDGKKVLLFFDNVRGAEQVMPLLPPPGCMTLITSRLHFDLPGLDTVDLETLAPKDARALIRKIARRVKAGEADEIAQPCGYLPLALRLAAGMLNSRPDWTSATLIEKLHDALALLGPVGASLQLSYELLDDPVKLHFRQLGVFPAPFDKGAASAVWEVDAEETDAALGVLLQSSLIDYDSKNQKYDLHNLVRQYAEKQLLKDGGEEHIAYLCHAQYYCAALETADELYLEGGNATLHGLQLFDSEWPHIQAAQSWLANRIDSSDEAARLYSRFTGAPYCLNLRLHAFTWITWLEKAIDADRQLGDRRGEGAALGNLGAAYADLGDARKASEFYEQQLVIVREIGDRRGEGAALGNLGAAYAALGDARTAIEFYGKALAIDREIGDRRGEGADLGNLGNAYAALGDARTAIEFYEQRIEIAREIGDRRGEGAALGNLGNAYAALGDARQAIEFHEQALAIAREIGDRRGEGAALGNLGNAYAALGDARKAIEFYEKALAIDREIGDRRGEGTDLGNLGLAYAALGEARKAIEFYEQQLVIVREIGDRRGEGNTLGNLGAAYAALGDARKAIEFYEKALAIDREIGDRRGEGAALGNLGLAYAVLGEARMAIEFHEKALAIYREIGDRRGEGNALGNLGNAYADLGDARQAIEFHEQALAIDREIGDRRGEGADLYNLGVALYGLGKEEPGIEHVKQALTIYEAIESPHAKTAKNTLKQWQAE